MRKRTHGSNDVKYMSGWKYYIESDVLYVRVYTLSPEPQSKKCDIGP